MAAPVRSSPAPLGNHIELDDYFKFCHVDIHSGGITIALAKLFINHYCASQWTPCPEKMRGKV
ncbi:hypothetical protein VP01_8571g1 [Puccinia sorghi]|uniref:Uncharacterized protein n=1 Tax=Puccinia sorghi TaxID=27349 RepID=A0A0L6U929_9BASI|nr:hypothetical protein VP01_8571g1 [Puccinia sorghi]